MTFVVVVPNARPWGELCAWERRAEEAAAFFASRSQKVEWLEGDLAPLSGLAAFIATNARVCSAPLTEASLREAFERCRLAGRDHAVIRNVAGHA